MDVDHLRQISEVETYTIFADSAQRDKSVFRSPNSYEIVFDRPFENVVGMEVLDASIPTTLYAVDSHNNSVCIGYRLGGTAGTAGKSIPDYMDALRGSASFQEMLRDPATPLHRVKIVAQYAKTLRTREDPESAYHVVYYGKASLQPVAAAIANVVDGEIVSLNDQLTGAPTRYKIRESAGGAGYTFRYAGESRDRPLAAFVQQGTLLAVVSVSDPATSELSFYTVIAEVFAATPTDDVNLIEFAGAPGGGTAAVAIEGFAHKCVTRDYYEERGTFLHEFNTEILRLEVGNHDVTSLHAVVQQALPKYSPTGVADDVTDFVTVASFSRRTPKDFTKDSRFMYTARDLFWFDMKKSTASDVLGFTEVADAPDVPRDGYQAIPGVNNRYIFGAVPDGNRFTLRSPGLTNLFGEKFVILRCPQIEEGGNASLSYQRFTTGIGLFKLYNSNFAHLRFDFTHLRQLEMHPIGKLAKLSLRFERADGSLYDFKGVDHHLLLAIKFLKPVVKAGAVVDPDRRLNPDYNPDVLKFLTTYYEDDLDESSTEDDEDLLADVRHRARFFRARAAAALANAAA